MPANCFKAAASVPPRSTGRRRYQDQYFDTVIGILISFINVFAKLFSHSLDDNWGLLKSVSGS